MEPLEDRSLLSASLGPIPIVGINPGNPPGPGGTVLPAPTNTATAATHFTVTLPSSIPAGAMVPVQVVALDANNKPAMNYCGTAVVTSTNSGDLLPASVTFQNGIASFPVSFAVQGSDTLTVTDKNTATLTGQTTVTVGTPAVATKYGISILPPAATGQPSAGQPQLPPPSTGTPMVPSGTTVTVQVVALDAKNEVVTSYDGSPTLTFSDSGTGAACPTSVTFVKGAATFKVTFVSTGTQTVQIADKANSLSGTLTVNVTTAAPAVATQYGICILPPAPAGQPAVGQPQLPPPSMGTPIVASGTTVTVQVVALDAQNHPVTSYTGTATLTLSDMGTGAACPASVTFVKGVATFQVTFVTTGSQSVIIADAANSLTGTLNVKVVSAPTTVGTTPGNGNPSPIGPGPGGPGLGGNGTGGQTGGSTSSGSAQGGATQNAAIQSGAAKSGSGQTGSSQSTPSSASQTSVKSSPGVKLTPALHA